MMKSKKNPLNKAHCLKNLRNAMLDNLLKLEAPDGTFVVVNAKQILTDLLNKNYSHDIFP